MSSLCEPPVLLWVRSHLHGSISIPAGPLAANARPLKGDCGLRCAQPV